jgi:hypothetical protein
MKLTTLAPVLILIPSIQVQAGPLAYGICQAGCAAVVTACYAAAGFTFGVALPAAPPAILACNSAFGACQAACVAAGCIPGL